MSTVRNRTLNGTRPRGKRGGDRGAFGRGRKNVASPTSFISPETRHWNLNPHISSLPPNLNRSQVSELGGYPISWSVLPVCYAANCQGQILVISKPGPHNTPRKVKSLRALIRKNTVNVFITSNDGSGVYCLWLFHSDLLKHLCRRLNGR